MASELEDVVVVVAPSDQEHNDVDFNADEEPRSPLLGGPLAGNTLTDDEATTVEPSRVSSESTVGGVASALDWLGNRFKTVANSSDETITMTEWKLAVQHLVSLIFTMRC